ncbi:Protein kinase, putative [Hondaea fermentalgiana]|uniref:non-specific serine/threonine protein kinase n=1 Tax=Hondaea fermentalgiana TaxID=2315210 RepID=A0A2R5GP63_9STRA|nr:Protein kinase, putative [Hondaea fermentalgiana]|eukprot:GBG32089.1 Protein kinase, putative [Hondaea fermentalgiana]
MSSARNSTHEIEETLDAAFAQLALAADGGLAQLEQPASLALAGEQNRVLRIPGRALHETKTREFAAMLGDIRGDPKRFVREIEARRQRDRECREDGEVGIGHASDPRSGDGVDEDEEKKVEEKKEDESSSPATDASETSQSTTSSKSNSRLKAFKVHSILGRGSFSTVYAATKLCDGTKYALKRVRLTGLESDQSRSKSVKEIRVLQSLDHPNIIKCFEHFHAPEGLFIVLEWAVAGDLKRMLKRVRAKQSRFHERVIWNYFVQISCALAFMHERRMIHRDIKPANVFVMPDGRIKLGDLGLSRALSQATVRAYSKVGTPLYMAPEVLQGAGHDFKSDVWSLGCLLYELAMLHSPFEVGCKTMKTLFTRILHAEYFPLSRTYSDRFARIVASILLTEPEDRPSARDVFRLAQERVQYYEHADGRPEEGHAAAPERSNHAHARDVRTPRRIQGPHMSRHSFCEGTASRTF